MRKISHRLGLGCTVGDTGKRVEGWVGFAKAPLTLVSHTTSAAIRLESKFETWAGEERDEHEDLCGRDVDHCWVWSRRATGCPLPSHSPSPLPTDWPPIPEGPIVRMNGQATLCDTVSLTRKTRHKVSSIITSKEVYSGTQFPSKH